MPLTKFEHLKENSTNEPLVSIIIPTRRHFNVLKQSLDSLETLDYPSDKIEIILAMNGDVQEEISSSLNMKILNLSGEYNHAQMRNAAVEQSKGEVLVFIDDDVVVDASWLRSGLKYFLSPEVGGIGGPGGAGDNLSFADRCSYYTLASPFSSGFASKRYYNTGEVREADENDLILCNNMIRREVFDKAGGFHSKQVPCEENDLYSRIIEGGWKLLYVPEMEVIHCVKPPMILICKAFWYGTGRGKFIVRKPNINMKAKFFIPVASFLFICGVSFISIFSSFARVALIAYLCAYSLLMLWHLTFIYKKLDRNPLLWFILPPITFFFQHAYGLGILTGIFKAVFLNRREARIPEVLRNADYA